MITALVAVAVAVAAAPIQPGVPTRPGRGGVLRPHVLEYLRDPSGECTELFKGRTSPMPILRKQKLREVRIPAELGDESTVPMEERLLSVKLAALNPELIAEYTERDCASWTVQAQAIEFDDAVVKKVVDSGPSSSRIDFVMIGDAYTADQEALFDADMDRLINDMFVDVTFASFVPLFNVWTVFIPSGDGELGNNRAGNTTVGLYRRNSELRGIYCGKPADARAACALAGECDYPILIGNDPYYGGLGGAFSISTKSETSGTLVLRHELGHSVGLVGDEYDASGSTFGANWASDLDMAEEKWGVWATDEIRAERGIMRVVDWPWVDLTANGFFEVPFESDGLYARLFIRLSISGAETDDAVKVLLDGEELPWNTTGIYDRSFSEFILPGLSAGPHVLRIEQVTPPVPGAPLPRQFCNLMIREMGTEEEHSTDNTRISAWPVSIGQRDAGWRPDFELCIMRNMSSPVFCAVDQENLYHQMLMTTTLIDGLEPLACTDSVAAYKLGAVGFGQFREIGVAPEGERYEVRWFKNGARVAALDDQFEVEFDRVADVGAWTVELELLTSEVRQKQDLLNFDLDFEITASGSCASF